MKLGACYNAFDGIELLESSIDSIRAVVDYVGVIYQEKSNFGNQPLEPVGPKIYRLVGMGKVDGVLEYVPEKYGGHLNELAKRNDGMMMCKHDGCTHFMSIDVDEFYVADELLAAKNEMLRGDFDSSACKMQTYYRTGEFVLDPLEEYFVPLIYKLDDRKLSMSTKWPVVADPTRRMEPGKIRIFEREEIQMHHMSYVRKDIRAKLINSSAYPNFKLRVEEIASHYENWEYGMQALLAGKERRLYNVTKVENKFNITDQCK